MIIEVDEYKKKIKGYDATRSEFFHSESAKLADKDFESALKTGLYTRVILMAGGTASGKTEYANSYLIHKDQLVYDGTLKNENGFKIKTKNIQKYTHGNAKIKVVLILPIDIMKALDIFFSRERKMPLKNFFFTQMRSKNTVSRILIETKTRVEIYVSEYKERSDKLMYHRLTIQSRKKTSQFLQELIGYEKDIALENGFDISLDEV